MKKILFVVLVMFAVACSRRMEKLELFSAESFAYSMDNGWELNATVRAKGFDQKENNNKFSAKLSYTIDLVNSDGKLIKGVDSGTINKTADEKLTELEINVQLKLDSTYKAGNCRVIFNVTDEFSKEKASLWSLFELSK